MEFIKAGCIFSILFFLSTGIAEGYMESKLRHSSFIKTFLTKTYNRGRLFPILRIPRSSWEKKMIKQINILVALFWIFFVVTMLMILIYVAF